MNEVLTRPKSERLNMRLTPAQRAQLEQLAEKRGTSMSGVVDQLIERAYRRECK